MKLESKQMMLVIIFIVFSSITFADTAQRRFSVGYITANSYIHTTGASANVSAPAGVYTTMTMEYTHKNIHTGKNTIRTTNDYGTGWRGVSDSAPTNERSVKQTTYIKSTYGNESWSVELYDKAY